MLATAIVVGGSVVGVAATGDGARLLAAHTAVEDLRRDVDRATAVVQGLRERVALVGTDLSDLRDLLIAARPSSRSGSGPSIAAPSSRPRS